MIPGGELPVQEFGNYLLIEPPATGNAQWILNKAALHLGRNWSLALHTRYPVNLLIDRSWPSSWWDAFKVRWFSAWMLRRWPARFEFLTARELLERAVGGEAKYMVKDTANPLRCSPDESVRCIEAAEMLRKAGDVYEPQAAFLDRLSQLIF